MIKCGEFMKQQAKKARHVEMTGWIENSKLLFH